MLPINFKLGARYINIANKIINMGAIMFAFIMAYSSAEGNPIQFIKYLESPSFIRSCWNIYIIHDIFHKII